MTTEAITAGDRSSIVGVVLAAGLGTRLQPLTHDRPKPLCPVGNVALVDTAIDRLSKAVTDIAVNVHAGRQHMEAHFGVADTSPVQLAGSLGRGGAGGDVPVRLSFEEPRVLGTAGGLGQLRWWIDGRAVLVLNGDSWTTAELSPFLHAWDRERVSVLLHDPDAARSHRLPEFTPRSLLVATLLPWRELQRLVPEPSGLYARCLAPAAAGGRLHTVASSAPFHDCGTPASYLAANLVACGAVGGSIISPAAEVTGRVEQSVVGDAVIEGRVRHSVVWSGSTVGATESLVGAIRTDGARTVLIRS